MLRQLGENGKTKTKQNKTNKQKRIAFQIRNTTIHILKWINLKTKLRMSKFLD